MKGTLLLVLAFRALYVRAQQQGFAFPRIPEGPDLQVPDVPDPPAPAPAPETQAPTAAPTAAPVPAVVSFRISHFAASILARTSSTFRKQLQQSKVRSISWCAVNLWSLKDSPFVSLTAITIALFCSSHHTILTLFDVPVCSSFCRKHQRLLTS
jgi:hypothetical protein